MENGTGRLVVHRPHTPWRDRIRAYRIEVDGETRLRIRQGETHDIVLAQGRHAVRAKIDWTGSREVEIHVVEGGTVECRVEPSGSAGNALWQVWSRSSWLDLTVTT